MVIVNYIAFILLAIGGLNWGLIGLLNFNLVTAIFGDENSMLTPIVYILVFLSMLWCIFSIIYAGGSLMFM